MGYAFDQQALARIAGTTAAPFLFSKSDGAEVTHAQPPRPLCDVPSGKRSSSRQTVVESSFRRTVLLVSGLVGASRHIPLRGAQQNHAGDTRATRHTIMDWTLNSKMFS